MPIRSVLPGMSRTRVGYIGVDHHHRDPYFQIANRLPIDLVALCEPGKEYTAADITPLADRPDEVESQGANVAEISERAEIFTDSEAMLADADLDAVWITYRNDEVPKIIDTAVENGVDVISEKPVARTAADLEPVAQRARDAGVTVGSTYFYRYNPVTQALRERVSDGLFGDIWSVDGRYVGSKLDYRNRDHYIYDEAASRGGSLQWIGLHWVDLFMYVLDEDIVRVCAQSRDVQGIDEGMTLQFETESGIMGTYQTGYYLGAPVKDPHFAVYGREATAQSPLHHNRGGGPIVPLEVQSDADAWAGAPTRTTDYEFSYDRFPAWGDYVLDFFGDFFEGRETGDVPADIDDTLRVLRVLDAAYESAETDRWVAVD